MQPSLTPAGYMYKRVEPRPDWVKSDGVRDIYSVSSCISEDFCDYVDLWKHNGYWLFDSLEVMQEIAREREISLDEMTPFYYRVHPLQWVAEAGEWEAFFPEPSFMTEVREPAESTVVGFDVVSFYARTMPECSPLSCNNLAETLAVNEHCLFASFASARTAVESGRFEGSEPGPLRIFEVRTL